MNLHGPDAAIDDLPERVTRLITERLRKCIEAISEKINVLQVRRDVDDQVREHMSKHEHEAFLRHKKRAIESELGREEDEDFDGALAPLARCVRAV